MADQSKILEEYINKMLQLQNEQREKPLTQQELKDIALDIGMSEEDWQVSQTAFQDYLTAGQTFLSHKNWNEAINSLDQAKNINPYDLQTNTDLAKALTYKWKESDSQSDREKAETAIRRGLAIKPAHKPLLDLQTEIAIEEKADKQKYRKIYITAGIGAGAVLLILLITYFSISGSVSSRKEQVRSAWTQVENVYNRRADLIPKLIILVKSRANIEKNIIQKIENAHSDAKTAEVNVADIGKNELKSFQEKQANLKKSLDRLMVESASDEKLYNTQAFQDLQIQIEGSENRISVERKRFNEQVQSYNAMVERFPYSLFGYEPQAYFTGDLKKTSVPFGD